MRPWHAPVIGIVLGGIVFLVGWASRQHENKAGTPQQQKPEPEAREKSPLPPPSGEWVPDPPYPDLKTWLRQGNPRIPMEIRKIDDEISQVRPKLRRAEDLRAELLRMAMQGGNNEALASKLLTLSFLISEIDGHVLSIASALEEHIRSYYRK